MTDDVASPSDDAPPLLCRRPRCGKPLRPRSGRGRPSRFCEPACAELFREERHAAQLAVDHAHAVLGQYEPVEVRTSALEIARVVDVAIASGRAAELSALDGATPLLDHLLSALELARSALPATRE